jgi:hypothetical protein
VPIKDINMEFDSPRGRIADHLNMAPDGNYTLVETKTLRALYNSYVKSGGVTGTKLKPSSVLSGEVSRETNVFDFARDRDGSTVEVSGVDFDGQSVDTALDPRRYRGPAPTVYNVIADQ